MDPVLKSPANTTFSTTGKKEPQKLPSDSKDKSALLKAGGSMKPFRLNSSGSGGTLSSAVTESSVTGLGGAVLSAVSGSSVTGLGGAVPSIVNSSSFTGSPEQIPSVASGCTITQTSGLTVYQSQHSHTSESTGVLTATNRTSSVPLAKCVIMGPEEMVLENLGGMQTEGSGTSPASGLQPNWASGSSDSQKRFVSMRPAEPDTVGSGLHHKVSSELNPVGLCIPPNKGLTPSKPDGTPNKGMETVNSFGLSNVGLKQYVPQTLCNSAPLNPDTSQHKVFVGSQLDGNSAFQCGGSGKVVPERITATDGEASDDEFRIRIITWNVGTAEPPDDVTSLLGLNAGEGITDMFIIGLQEVNSMINKRLKDAIFTDEWSELFMEVLGRFNYVLVTSVRMQGVLLLVFAKYFHLPFLRDVQTECTRTGFGGYWGNKGGVSVRLSVFGHMVCFLNCHLPAHMENAEQRMNTFESILQLQQFSGPLANGVLDHDVVFWFGDLNFRLEDYDLQFVKYAIDCDRLHLLWEKDQLNMAKGVEPVLSGFIEGPLKFPPTYKYDVGTNNYDSSSKKRKPAWTDRILWKIKDISRLNESQNPVCDSRVTVTQRCYSSHMEYLVSDHKPVSAVFYLKFSYRVSSPLVHLEVEDEWHNPSEAVVKFKVAPTFSRSSWDWIGLYKVGFHHHKDYVAYVWARQEDSDGFVDQYQAVFNEESLPKGTGDYILGYYSNNLNTIVGVTEPFQILLPGSSSSSEQSESSDSSSDGEDNSMLELLRPKSRSPSPGMKRQHGSRSRSRSPGLPKFQALNLMVSSHRKGKNRSPSPRGARTPKHEVSSDHISHIPGSTQSSDNSGKHRNSRSSVQKVTSSKDGFKNKGGKYRETEKDGQGANEQKKGAPHTLQANQPWSTTTVTYVQPVVSVKRSPSTGKGSSHSKAAPDSARGTATSEGKETSTLKAVAQGNTSPSHREQ
ncbi:phosphatidylinositol 4,5-bisphosphate 5-phosphatase A [Protopterus annectens]|uniref:phosphatidylinositol 4,5-bisphosphate 5-phosphatase A n=1 Tax=Protopterus annectens TaxID=7888 RepID=UPI001CFC3CDC|nr:phosphatidylinositol 4,5-bisphosphate 5-phosphatase A [Protopterus annectens]